MHLIPKECKVYDYGGHSLQYMVFLIKYISYPLTRRYLVPMFKSNIG